MLSLALATPCQLAHGQSPFDTVLSDAEKGHVGAMFEAAEAYRSGRGVTRDVARSIDWYRKAAAAGHGRSMLALGLIHRNGEGVARDYAESLRWMQRAAGASELRALYHLGEAYHFGLGTPIDRQQAASLYRRTVEAFGPEAEISRQARKRLQSLPPP